MEWWDRTLYQGFRQGLDKAILLEMLELLGQLGLSGAVVPLSFPTRRSAAPFSLTASISTEPGQLAEAYQQGFTKVLMTCRYPLTEEALSLFQQSLTQAAVLGMDASVEIENGSALGFAAWEDLWQILKPYPIQCLIYGDEAGVLEPLTALRVFQQLQGLTAVPWGFHGNNRQGVAVGNALSALRAGMKGICCSIGGVGRQTPFEEVLMATKYLLGKEEVSVPYSLAPLCQRVLQLLGRTLPVHKPVIGANVFAHESGLHVYGILKDPALYEPFSPERVGLERKVIVGKHAGASNLYFLFQKQGIRLEGREAGQLLQKVKALTAYRQKTLTVDEVLSVYRQEVRG